MEGGEYYTLDLSTEAMKEGVYLEIDRGRYLAIKEGGHDYYISNIPRRIKGGMRFAPHVFRDIAPRARFFAIDRGDGLMDLVGVGIIMDKSELVWLAGDEIRDGLRQEEDEGSKRVILRSPPLVHKHLKEKKPGDEHLSYLQFAIREIKLQQADWDKIVRNRHNPRIVEEEEQSHLFKFGKRPKWALEMERVVARPLDAEGEVGNEAPSSDMDTTECAHCRGTGFQLKKRR